jgi:superfamily II DNA or RNA helicase
MKREPSSRDKREARKNHRVSGPSLLDWGLPSTPEDLARGSDLDPMLDVDITPQGRFSNPADFYRLEYPLRDYQVEAVERVFEEWKYVRSTLIVMAMGAGKTIIARDVCRRVLLGEVGKGGFLFVAHRDELIEQAFNTFRKSFPGARVEVEKGEERASHQADIVVGSVQTLGKQERIEMFARDRFAAVCIDEFHHAVKKNKTYKRICEYFRAKFLGLTATPDRRDEQALGQLMDTVAVNFDIQYLKDEGWLLPIGQRSETCTELDLSIVGTDEDGEFDPREIDDVMRGRKMLFALRDAAIKYSNYKGGQRSTVVFTTSIDHAKDIAVLLNEEHAKHGTGLAAAVHYKSKDRKQLLEMFQQKRLRYLVNMGILTEGWDCDHATVIVNGRPIRNNRALYNQICGRAIRPLKEIVPLLAKAKDKEERKKIIAESKKPGSVIIDLCGVNHKLVLTMTDVLGGKYTDEVVDYVKARVAKSQGPVDVEAELEAARLEQEKRDKEERRKRIFEKIQAQVTFVGKNVDLFDIYDVSYERDPDYYSGKRISYSQKRMLTQYGIPETELDISASRAHKLIEICKYREKSKLCTYRQGQLLAKFGYFPDVSRDEACAVLEKLRASGWKRPKD